MDAFRTAFGELRLLERTGEFIFPVELWMLNDSVNDNGWQFINLEEHRAQWAGVPILCAYVNGGRTVGDGHNQRSGVDPVTGKPWSSFTAATAERIVGAISENPDDIRLEERDGYTWVVAKGFLWAWYARELVMKIEDDARQGRDMSVSVETLVTANHMEGDVEVEEAYLALGVTILGDHVRPAVQKAHIAMLSSMGDEFRELKLRAASYLEPPEASKKPQSQRAAAETAPSPEGGESGPGEPQKNCETAGILPSPEGGGGGSDSPQKNSIQKELRYLSYLSKQQVKDLQGKFGEAYTVLSARKNGDKLTVLLVRNEDVAFGVYIMGEDDSMVDVSRITYRDASISVELAEGDLVVADAYDYVHFRTMALSGQVKDLSAQVEALTGERDKAVETMKAMEAAENARRLAAAKDVAAATLEAFNAHRADKVDVKALEALNKDIEAGKFSACADESGAWTGDKAVAEKVKALCADAVMELDKKNEKRFEPMTWGSARRAAAEPGTVGELFAGKN